MLFKVEFRRCKRDNREGIEKKRFCFCLMAQGVNFVDCSKQKLVLARVFGDLETNENIALRVAKRKRGAHSLCSVLQLSCVKVSQLFLCSAKLYLLKLFFNLRYRDKLPGTSFECALVDVWFYKLFFLLGGLPGFNSSNYFI